MLTVRLLLLAPRQVRRTLLNAMPAHLRLQAARRLVGRLGPHPRSRRAERVRSVVGVRDGDAWVDAEIVHTATPVSIRRANLDRVVAALDAAGIAYFRLPVKRALPSAVAVVDTDADRVLELIRHAPALRGAHLRVDDVVYRPGGRIERADLSGACVVELFWPVTNAAQTLVLGSRYSCAIEFWHADGDTLVAPRPNQVSEIVPRDDEVVWAPERVFGQLCPPVDDSATYPTRRSLARPTVDWIDFPIDAVYTWVDGQDTAWLNRKERALTGNDWTAVNHHTANASRFICRDELRYSLRSLVSYAPWIRRIFLVTDDQVPPWLDVEHPDVTLVSHREIFGDTGRLPTFNSHAIESRLHRIPGLAEHFVYLNDDVFFGRPVAPSRFFLPDGSSRFFPSRATIAGGPPTPDDLPVMAAGKNNRRLILREFGRHITQKMKHTPHPVRRSVLEEIERRCADEVLATAAHQFRHPDDLSITSSLHHYWSYLTGRAVPGSIRYLYADLANPATPIRLRNLLQLRNFDVFCLNDTDAEPAVQREQAAMLADFLPAYFPFPAPFERDAWTPTRPPDARALVPHPTTRRSPGQLSRAWRRQ